MTSHLATATEAGPLSAPPQPCNVNLTLPLPRHRPPLIRDICLAPLKREIEQQRLETAVSAASGNKQTAVSGLLAAVQLCVLVS